VSEANPFPGAVALLAAVLAGCGATRPEPPRPPEPAEFTARPIDAPDPPVDGPELRAAVLAAYAAHAHRAYAEAEVAARELLEALRELERAPTAAALDAARRTWIAAREPYGETEALRFYGGPVDDPADGVESLMNAWPVDEAYIAHPERGILFDEARHPRLDATLLTLWNQRGGEAHVSVGWHAIEFLLWGADTSLDGPGDRPYTDFVPGAAPQAERRARYAVLCGELLAAQLAGLRDAWAPGDGGYRAEFLGAPHDAGLRKMLAGITILSAFEMSGERLAVAYETRDQEEEHSCFSDNTHADLAADQRGILAVWRGEGGPGLRALAVAVEPELAAEIDAALEASLAAVQAIPPPFDQAIQGDDDAPGRRAVLAALLALERQSELLATFALTLGFEIALHPGG